MPETRAGHLSLADAELFFKPCGSKGAPQRLDDGTNGDAIKMLRAAKGPAGGLMVLVRLEGDTLAQVRHASVEQTMCSRLPSSATLDANGNEPFWGVRIEGGVATYRTPWDRNGIVYQDGTWTRVDDKRWRYVARGTGTGGGALTLELEEVRCVDSMADAVFPFVAKLTRADSTFSGCALEGNGRYAQVAADSADSVRAVRPRAAPPVVSALSGTVWRLAEIGGEPVVDKVQATLEFARGGKVAGSGSCNRFSGTVTVAADSIAFGPVVSTRMACADAVMRQERAYLQALGEAERYTREGNTMFIHRKGGAKPLRFEPY